MDKELIFTKGFVYRRNIVYIRAVMTDLEMQERDHAFMFRWKEGKWAQWSVNRRIVAHGAFDIGSGRFIILVSNDGFVQIGDYQGFRWETIDETRDSPNNLRSLKCLTVIKDFIYVAGMQRMVYRKPPNAVNWERFDQGVRIQKSSKEIAGFSAISGTSNDDLYGVGLTGQVWHYNGKQWRQLDVGTNLGLHDIEVVSPKKIYICGNSGIVLKGHGGQWETVTNTITDFDFYSIVRLKDRIFLSTNQGELFEIKNEEIAPVDIGIDKNLTTYSLHANDGVMVSVGSDHILMFDGTSWIDLGRPDATKE